MKDLASLSNFEVAGVRPLTEEFPIGVRFPDEGGCVISLYLNVLPNFGPMLSLPESCSRDLVLLMAEEIVRTLQAS
jgi:hypothetical protein